MSAGFVVLSRDPLVRGTVMNAGIAAGELYLVAADPDELYATVEAVRPRIVVIDREHADSDAVVRRLAKLRDQMLIAVVIRDLGTLPPRGAHVLVFEPLLDKVLELDRGRSVGRGTLALDQLVHLSVLSGQLDPALETAATQVASGFAVDRCVISVRGDSTGAGAVGAHTWDSIAWSRTADYCRAAAACGATLVTAGANGQVESYLAVALDTPLGSQGFLGLVVDRARIFPRDHNTVLQAIASRIGSELGWRAVHQRTAEELDRVLNGPGLDPLLGVWNRHAMTQLVAMQVSASRRSQLPLSAVVVDVLDLQSINTRFGLQTGDRLLQRIADGIRTNVRTEDTVGRWSGDKIAIVLPATSLDGAQRVAERFKATLSARSLELPGGGTLEAPVTVGLAVLGPNEDGATLVARAAQAAKRARQGEVPIARASTGPSPRISQQIDLGEDMRATLGGAYRLLHEISRGGMGVVYRAEDLALERPVAIKMLRPDLAEDKAFVEHLRGEAAMLARLEHPNLVQIYNFGQSGGDSYFVMELLEGEGLQQAIDRHRIEGTTMPLPDVVHAIEQVASALDALHERGIIHRDVKPANVIRDPFRSRSVLVDVGIAHRYGQFAESAGTPGYVAPEVITGHEATPRADVYGLAATTYTLLTLNAPWGDDDNVLRRQVKGELPPAPSTVRDDLLPVDDLFVRALGRDPARRPRSAGAFAKELKAALAPAMPAAPPDSPRWVANTILPSRGVNVPKTRGVVFRSFVRALGLRDSERLRDALGGTNPELARTLTDTAPLAWLPTEHFQRLLAVAPTYVERDSARLARDVARATVRTSFRRFFPASAATLIPERTLSAIRNVWSRYQTWGTISSMPVSSTEAVIRLTGSLKSHELCVWTSGMLEQLVVLSGGRSPVVDHEACESRDDDACLFRVTWQRGE